MATSTETPSPVLLKQDGESLVRCSPVFSPSSDQRFWSNLRSRIDKLLEERENKISNGEDTSGRTCREEKAKRLKEDSLLLIRGFDSVAHTLSQLSNNLDNALEGARGLADPPSLTDIFQSKFDKSESKDQNSGEQENEESKKGIKRKFNPNEFSEDQANESQKANEKTLEVGNLKKAKNIAVSMATKAASLARELKSIKSDLCFMQERCALLEEENRRLRDGFDKGIRPEEDDLVRLQLEALLAEKSRLANENANLTRENQCLHQLVEYHQVTSQDLSASYEQVIQGLCLDFSSPLPTNAGEETEEEDVDYAAENKELQTHKTNLSHISTPLDDRYEEEE